jgi:hypothetical protein
MDSTKLRSQGKPKHPLLMKMNIVCFRLCLIANYSGRDPQTDLGPWGIRLKRGFETTRTSGVIKSLLIPGSKHLAGIGGNSIVLRSHDGEDMVEKFNYTLAGADEGVLREFCTGSMQQQAMLAELLGDIVLPCAYSLAPLPARYPFNKLITIQCGQRQLRSFIDLFDAGADSYMSNPANTLLAHDVRVFHEQMTQLISQDVWIDIIGPHNLVITEDFGSPCLRLIDAELYPPEYLEDVNPVIGKPYRAVFKEKIARLEELLAIADQAKPVVSDHRPVAS